MKKTIAILLLAVMVVGPLAALDIDPSSPAYELASQEYTATSARTTGMGGAGLNVTGYSDSFLINPANLGQGKFRLSLPTASVTLFNVKKLLDNGFFDSFGKYIKNRETADLTSAGVALLSALTYGQNEIERIDAGFNLAAGPVGFAVQAQERLYGYLSGSDFSTGKYVGDVTAAVTLGLGFRIPFGYTDDWSVDIGASASLVYRMFTQSITSVNVLGMIDKSFDIMNDTKLMSGYAIPIKAGVNLNMPLGFKMSVVGDNINGKFKYTVHDSAKSFFNGISFNSLFPSGADFTYDEGFRLNTGFSWEMPENKVSKFISPSVALDFYDMTHMTSKNNFFARVYLGAQVRLFSFLDVRYGIAQGYQSIGLGLDLWIFHIDASYWRADYGANYLDKSTDAFTIRFTLFTK